MTIIIGTDSQYKYTDNQYVDNAYQYALVTDSHDDILTVIIAVLSIIIVLTKITHVKRHWHWHWRLSRCVMMQSRPSIFQADQ
jgi:hypothetical protein